jgi:hypothetical protein
VSVPYVYGELSNQSGRLQSWQIQHSDLAGICQRFETTERFLNWTNWFCSSAKFLPEAPALCFAYYVKSARSFQTGMLWFRVWARKYKSSARSCSSSSTVPFLGKCFTLPPSYDEKHYTVCPEPFTMEYRLPAPGTLTNVPALLGKEGTQIEEDDLETSDTQFA